GGRVRQDNSTPGAAMGDLNSLTERQREIYDFICTKIDEAGYPPTIRDIGSQFEIKSPNGVMCHLKALEKKGPIRRIRKAGRLVPTAKPPRAIHLTHPPPSRQPAGLPFYGLVAAGAPIASEEQTDRLDPYDLFGGQGHFVLKVRGQSMIEDHIEDGDFVVIKK